jgi:uridine kinase
MMNTQIKVTCLNTGTNLSFKKGTPLSEVMTAFQVKTGNPILGALVNNVLEELTFEVFHPLTVRFIDVTSADGLRMYLRGLSFVLYKAMRELFPERKLRMKHSISKGVYCKVISPGNQLSIREVADVKERMSQIIAAGIPFVRMETDTEEVKNLYISQGLDDKISLLNRPGRNYTTYYQLGEDVNSFYGRMIPTTGHLGVFDLNHYYRGMLLRFPQRSNPTRVETIEVQNKLFEIFQEFTEWISILDVANIQNLNQAIVSKKADELIKISEALHEKKIGQIADQIRSRTHPVRIILISGPSSSGKTTFAKRLAVHLLVNGMKPLTLSLDNYFHDRENTPRDDQGNYDFEALEALDTELFNQQLVALLNGESVSIPKFSFEQGKRIYDGETLQMGADNVLIIEGIHGLNPRLTLSIPPETKFRIYVSALTTLNMDNMNRASTTDNRLIRRIIRDYRYRKYSAQDTISRWPSVRQGEEKHIFPFQEEADTMFNSALIYELAVLKPFAEPILLEVQPNQAEYSEATRLLDFFSYFRPLSTGSEIPPTSILREFLGGSSFTY